jgi:plasmid stability protein
MSMMIQVRNVPDTLHRELVRRARARGQTLTAYVQEVLERDVSRPDRRDVVRRIRELPPVRLSRPITEYIAEGRDERESPRGRRGA